MAEGLPGAGEMASHPDFISELEQQTHESRNWKSFRFRLVFTSPR